MCVFIVLVIHILADRSQLTTLEKQLASSRRDHFLLLSKRPTVQPPSPRTSPQLKPQQPPSPPSNIPQTSSSSTAPPPLLQRRNRATSLPPALMRNRSTSGGRSPTPPAAQQVLDHLKNATRWYY